MTTEELKSLNLAIFHRFIKFQAGMSLLRIEGLRPGVFKVVESGKGSETNVPDIYLNSLEHIDKPIFVPDLDHDPTINQCLVSCHGSQWRFENYSCPVWKETGWIITSDDANMTDVFSTKASALLWSLVLYPPF